MCAAEAPCSPPQCSGCQLLIIIKKAAGVKKHLKYIESTQHLLQCNAGGTLCHSDCKVCGERNKSISRALPLTEAPTQFGVSPQGLLRAKHSASSGTPFAGFQARRARHPLLARHSGSRGVHTQHSQKKKKKPRAVTAVCSSGNILTLLKCATQDLILAHSKYYIIVSKWHRGLTSTGQAAMLQSEPTAAHTRLTRQCC